MTIKSAYAVCALVGMLVVTGSAKTVALWTWNQDPERGNCTGRSSVSHHVCDIISDRGSAVVNHADSTGVYPNVDVPDGLNARDLANDGYGITVGTGYGQCATLNPVLEMTNSWTVEGWFSMKWLPGNGNWLPIFHTRANVGGWLFSVRQHTQGVYNYELFADGGAVNDNTYFLGDLDDTAITNGWKHLALVYDHDATGVPGKGVWTFYIDGVQAGASITNLKQMTTSINSTYFQLMGRGDHKNQFDMDYVRVSDEALTPDQFLCAAPIEPVASAASDDTLGFWRLDQDGSVENLVGNPSAYPLAAGPQHGNMTSFKAFETCPNASAGVPANQGSAFTLRSGESLTVANVGPLVDFDQPFTLEGWFFMQEWATSFSGSNARLLFSTRTASSGYGFHLWYNLNAGNLSVYARALDQLVEVIGEEGTEDEGKMKTNYVERVQVQDRRFPITPEKLWNAWHHVALTYDPAGATLEGGVVRGVWGTFVDGKSLGCITNALDSTEVSGMTHLYLGGRPGTGAVGHIDTVRLTKRVLEPSEFLCTEGGTSPAAADVEALWPLDLVNLVSDGRDLMNRHPLWTNYATDIGFSPDGAVERVPNPPVGVAGGARNDGSIAFPVNPTKNNYLSVANIHKELNLTKDFTVEAWFRIDALPSGWGSLFINGTGSERWCWWIRNLAGQMRYMMLVQHGGSNYTVPDNTRFSNDADCPVPTDGKWHHHALVYRAKQGAAERGQFEMFLDGQSLGTIDRNANFNEAIAYGNGPELQIGGRSSDSARALQGCVDLLRVSARALGPSEFLNAEPTDPPAVTAARTVGYWKLDENDMFSSSVNDLMKFVGGSLVASAEQFGRTVRRPDDSTNFVGVASANAGSVRVNGTLCSHGAASWTQIDRSFSLEGWIKLEKEGTKPFPQTLISTERTLGGLRGDWALSLADAQTFRLFARDQGGYITVSHTFAVPPKYALPGEWRHLALVHDAVLDVWHLHLDGTEIGSVAAATFALPAVQSIYLGSLALGYGQDGNTFDGLLDTWRLSYGVRTPDDFLFVDVPKGTLITIR